MEIAAALVLGTNRVSSANERAISASNRKIMEFWGQENLEMLHGLAQVCGSGSSVQ